MSGVLVLAMCYASVITRYDRRTSDLSKAPLYMKQDASSIEV